MYLQYLFVCVAVVANFCIFYDSILSYLVTIPFMLQTNQKVTVHVNNEQSRNCCSSRGLSVFAVEVPARTKMVRSLPENTVLVIMTRFKKKNPKSWLWAKMFYSTPVKCKMKCLILNKKILLLELMWWYDGLKWLIQSVQCVFCPQGVPTRPAH